MDTLARQIEAALRVLNPSGLDPATLRLPPPVAFATANVEPDEAQDAAPSADPQR